MSVIQELFENYEHIPLEFRRQLLMMRELDERTNKLIEEREKLKRDLLRKHAGESADEEEKRIKKQYSDLQQIYERIESLTEEKVEITEKLFLIQENFIRKLDQQIEKTEEDKEVLQRVSQDHQRDQEEYMDQLVSGAGINQKGLKKQKPGRVAGGSSTVMGGGGPGGWGYPGKDFGFGGLNLNEKAGRGGILDSQGAFDSSGFGALGSKKNKGGAFQDSMFSSSFGPGTITNARGASLLDVNQSSGWNLAGVPSVAMGGAGAQKKRDRTRDQKKGGVPLTSTFNKSRKTTLQQDPTFSQDVEMIEHKGDEEVCQKCQTCVGENWVQCDGCDKWYHISCLGLTELPGDDEPYSCPDCQKKEANGLMSRSISEMPNQDIFNAD